MQRLAGKTAVITGGGRGQGRAHAVEMAREGAQIAICDTHEPFLHTEYTVNSPEDIEETRAAVEAVGGKCLTFEVDVRNPDLMRDMMRSVVETYGAIDVVIANAGIDSYAPVQTMTSEKWNDVIDVNLTGVFNTISAVADHMIERRAGSIIAISSSVGRLGVGNNPAYVASKWGVIGLVKSAALDLGHYDIRVNAVCPGYVSTGMVNNQHLPRLFFPHDPDATNEMVDQVINERQHAIPAGRLAPEEISHAVIFLASDESRFISGSTIDVNAGWSANYTA